MKYFFLSLVILLISTSDAKVIEKVMAVVDDEMISLSQVYKYKRLIASDIPYPSILFKLRSKKLLRKSTKHTLNQLVDESVLKNNIVLEQLNVPSAEKVLAQTLKTNRLSKKNLVRKLKKINLPLEEYKELLFYNEIYQALFNMEVLSGISVTFQDIHNFYFEKHNRYLSTKHKYDFHQWEFPFTKKGKKEATLFSTHKQTGNTKDGVKKYNPVLKSLNETQMHIDIKKIISQLSVGQFSRPVCLQKRCYVFELINKQFMNVDNARVKKIRKQLFNRRLISKMKNWIKNKRNLSIIKKYI